MFWRLALVPLIAFAAGAGCKPKVVDPVGTWSTPIGSDGLVVTLNGDHSFKMVGQGVQQMGGKWSISGNDIYCDINSVDGKAVNQDLNAPPKVTAKDIETAHGGRVIPSKSVYEGLNMKLSPDGKTLTWASFGMSVAFTRSGSK